MKQKEAKAAANEAKVIALAHCLLNQATRWRQNNEMPKASGPAKEVIETLFTQKIGVIQLPCPEFTFCGNPRPPRTKDEYENLPGFRQHCERLAEKSAGELKALATMGNAPRIRVLAIIGVEHSPTCSVNSAPRGVGCKAEYANEMGLFFEILGKEIEKSGLKIPFMEMGFRKSVDFGKQLDEFLKCKDL